MVTSTTLPDAHGGRKEEPEEPEETDAAIGAYFGRMFKDGSTWLETHPVQRERLVASERARRVLRRAALVAAGE